MKIQNIQEAIKKPDAFNLSLNPLITENTKVINNYLKEEEPLDLNIKEVSYFITTSSKTSASRKIDAKGIDVFPAIKNLPAVNSDDPSFHEFLRRSREELDFKEPRYDDFGVSLNGLNNDTSCLAFLSGYSMDGSYPSLDNTLTRYYSGLNNPDLRTKQIARDVASLMLEELHPTAPYLSLSSFGFPLFLSSFDVKMEIFNYLFDNIDDLYDLVLKNRIDELYARYFILFGAYTGSRLQWEFLKDNQPKKREINSLDYALTGGRKGKRVPADRSTRYPNLYNLRRRWIFAFNFTTNILPKIYMDFTRKAYSTKFPFAFKHQTHIEKLDKLNSLEHEFTIGLDVHQYDETATSDLAKIWYDEMKKKNLLIGTLLERISQSPYYQTPVQGNPGQWVASPLDINALFNPGLLSGEADVSDRGKFENAVNVIRIIEDVFKVTYTKDEMRELLSKGLPNIAFQCMSDDIAISALSRRTIQMLQERISHYVKLRQQLAASRSLNKEISIKEAYEEMDSALSEYTPHLAIDIELPSSYLGDLLTNLPSCFYDTNLRSRSLQKLAYVPKITSFLGNTFVPEWGRTNDFFLIGFHDRLKIYSRNPNFEYMLESCRRIFRDTIGFDFVSEYMKLYDQSSDHDLSQIDREVNADPTKLKYKYDADDVSPVILERYTRTFDPDTSQRLFDYFNEN